MRKRADEDRRVSEWRDRLNELVLGAIPDAAVRWTAARWAPFTRSLVRSRRGAEVLAHATSLLGRPPPGRSGAETLLPVDEIAQRLGRSEDEVRRWARQGMLGEPARRGSPPVYGRDAYERAQLIVYLRRHGVSEEVVREEAAQGRLPLLVVDRTLAGHGSLTRDDVAERAGLDPETIEAFWRAWGLARADPEDRVYTHADLQAFRVIASLRGIFTDDDLLEAASVMAQAMAQVADSEVELFRRRMVERFAESGPMQAAFRLAALVELLVPPITGLLEMTHRRHLEEAVRAESVASVEAATGTLPGQVDLSVGFADLVGFTAASQQLGALEVAQMAATLYRCAEQVFPDHGARLVKTVGDGLLFTARDAVAACVAACALLDAASAVEELPPVRAGIAHGPVLRRHADVFGRIVNMASRLCDVAGPGEVLLLPPDPAIADEAWRKANLAVVDRPSFRLRGIQGRVKVLRLKPR